MKDIIEALKKGLFPSYHWSPLGLQLNLLQPTLSSIKANHKDDVDSCLQECLTLWLSKANKVSESEGPTWDSLASALNKINENFTAEKIKEFSEVRNWNLCYIMYIFKCLQQKKSQLLLPTKCYSNTLIDSHFYSSCGDCDL